MGKPSFMLKTYNEMIEDGDIKPSKEEIDARKKFKRDQEKSEAIQSLFMLFVWAFLIYIVISILMGK